MAERTGSERAESPPRGYQADGGLVPVPDPTLLTTQLVDKAIKALEDKLQTRFGAMDEAARLVREDYTRVPTQVDRATANLREFLEEKITKLSEVSREQFARIAIQFDERDKRTEQLSQAQKEAANALSLASATAIAAALQAQKEAAGAQNDSNAAAIMKSEAAFTKQIDQMGALVQQIQKGNDDKVADLKAQLTSLGSRLDRGEGAHTGSGAVWGYIAVVVTILISAATLGILISAKLH